jgi:hypothetical protein
LRLHSFAPFTVGKELSKGGFSLIKTTTTVTFVTPHCFRGRHDDSGIVDDEREGLVMDGKERERGSRRRGERERRRKNSNELGEGAISTPLPMVGTTSM